MSGALKFANLGSDGGFHMKIIDRGRCFNAPIEENCFFREWCFFFWKDMVVFCLSYVVFREDGVFAYCYILYGWPLNFVFS